MVDSYDSTSHDLFWDDDFMDLDNESQVPCGFDSDDNITIPEPDSQKNEGTGADADEESEEDSEEDSE